MSLDTVQQDLRELQKQWADISIRLQEMSTNITYIKKNQAEQRDLVTEHTTKLHELETNELRKAAFFTLLGQHWWKAILVLTPVIAFLLEIGIYLRHLPPPK